MKNYILNFVKEWNLNDWILGYLILFSILNIKLVPIGIVILLISIWFNKSNVKVGFTNLVSLKNPLFWMMLFFLYHLVGMIWTSNNEFGWSDIGMKASFLLLPIIFSIGKFNWSFQKVMSFLVLSQVVTVLFLLGLAVFKSLYYEEDNRWAYFFENEFSGYMHRSYFATYTSIGAIVSFFAFWRTSAKRWFIFTTILLSTATILTLSKAGTILLILTFTFAFIWMIWKKKMVVIGSLFSLGILSFVFFLIFSNSKIASRLQEVGNSLSHFQTTNNSGVESNTARIIMWATSCRVISNNVIFGTGTGDVKDVLIAKNFELNNLGVANSKLNSHNQYLNSWVQLGIFGLIFLIGIFFTAFKIALKNKNLFQFFIVFIFAISLLFESFLETQAGIIPFCLFVSLIFSLKQNMVHENEIKY